MEMKPLNLKRIVLALSALALAPAFAAAQSFAYVANHVDNTVSGYTINAATGALTPVPGSPFATGTMPTYVTVDPTGKFAYVTNEGDNDVSGYTINATTGALTPTVPPTFAAGGLLKPSRSTRRANSLMWRIWPTPFRRTRSTLSPGR